MSATKSTPKSIDRITLLRLSMGATLLLVAVAFGLGTYYGLSASEQTLVTSQFDSVSSTAVTRIQDTFGGMKNGVKTFATMYSNQFPDESQWPYVLLPGFYETASLLAETAGIDSLLFSPVVKPEPGANATTQTEYEKFLYNYFDSEPAIPANPFPPNPGFAFRGIFSVAGTFFDYAKIYHDVTGEQEWGTNRTDLYPLAQATFGGQIVPLIMARNLYNDVMVGPKFDDVNECVEGSASYEDALDGCGRFRPWFYNPNTGSVNGAGFVPIMLRQNTSKVVGIASLHFDWVKLLSNTVPDYEGDIDVVITGGGYDENRVFRDDFTFTYTIVNGIPRFSGVGDLHDSTYTDYGWRGDRISIFETSTDITFYPRASFVEAYRSDNPVYLGIAAVALIALCSLVFAAYDFVVSRKSESQQIVLDTKRRFVRFISHEVRTPLNTVRLGMKLFELELLKTKKAMASMSMAAFREELSKSIDNWMELTYDVLGNSEAAVDVLSDLLNYDKIESGTLRLEFSMVSIFKVVTGIYKAFGLQAMQKSIDLKLAGAMWDKDTPPADLQRLQRLGVVGDSTRIAQVLRNLLSNALKFTPEKGRVQIQAEWDANGLPSDVSIDVPADQFRSTETLLQQPRSGAIRIAVTDSGAGLSEDQLAQICNEGVQFNANQLQAGQGSGLGLFISKGIIEQHGGKMDVASKGLGLGTTFTITLPVFTGAESMSIYESTEHNSSSMRSTNAESTAQCDGVADADTGTGGGSSRRRHRILVVDDALSNRKLLSRILRTRGYDCEEAVDGEKAVAQYQDMCSRGEPPDAILSDYEMPVMNGPDAVSLMRQLGCRCFIMGITGNVMQSDIDYFKAHGADAVLAKPLNTDTFESLFKQHLQQQHFDRRTAGGGGGGAASPHTGEITGQAESKSGNAKYHPLGNSTKVQPYEEEEELV